MSEIPRRRNNLKLTVVSKRVLHYQPTKNHHGSTRSSSARHRRLKFDKILEKRREFYKDV